MTAFISRSPLLAHVGRVLPGLVLCGGLAGVAMLVARVPFVADTLHLGTAILAILAGMVFRNTAGMPATLAPGVRFSLKRVLRLAIVLLGFRLVLQDVAGIGVAGLALVTLTVAAGFGATYGISRHLGLNPKFSMMMASGHAICGASAIVAADAVVRGREQDAACAVGVISLLGTAAMFVYPLLGQWLGLSVGVYAGWTGASIHEVAQVVGAGFAVGPEQGTLASLFKLTRVLFIVPVTMLLAVWMVRSAVAGSESGKSGGQPFPWFVLGFVAVIALNTTRLVPESAVSMILRVDAVLLAVAMAALGLGVDLAALRRLGPRPLVAGLASSLVISVVGLGLAWGLLA